MCLCVTIALLLRLHYDKEDNRDQDLALTALATVLFDTLFAGGIKDGAALLQEKMLTLKLWVNGNNTLEGHTNKH